MACRFALWALSALFVLSCSQEPPVSSPSSASAEESGPWETVSINGATYRRVAAKPTETSQADLLITIPISYTVEGGAVRFSDTVQIAGRTYTADCGADSGQSGGGDDVGNTQETATRLTVPEPGTTQYEFWFSPEYEITRGDEDHFRLYVPRQMWLGISSRGSTDVKGWLYDQNGRVIDEDDDSSNGLNFLVLNLVGSGTYYLRVTGARTSTSGSYSLSVGTRLPDGAGKPVAQAEVERIKAALLDRNQ